MANRKIVNAQDINVRKIKSLGDIKSIIDPKPEVASLRSERDELRKALRKQQEQYNNLYGLFSELGEIIGDLSLSFDKAPPVTIIKPKDLMSDSPIEAVIHWTDWHMGMVQDPVEIEGIGAYNSTILEYRIMKEFVPTYLKWVNVHRKNYKVPNARILDTGDNISGDIHEELKITNEFPTPYQCVKVAELKAKAIRDIAANFELVTIEYLVEDNHSRLTAKPQAKQAGMNSFNYIVGYITKKLLKDIDNVIFNIYPQNMVTVNVNGMRYLLTHGHDVKGWMGVPWYGIERKVSKEARNRLHDPDPRKFDKLVMGHFHCNHITDDYNMGGSPSGTDAYDHKNGRRSRPSQSAWMVHPQHKEFDHIKIRLEGYPEEYNENLCL